MSMRRAMLWAVLLGIAAAVYIVSVIVTGQITQNGAWLVLVLVFIGAGIDGARQAFRGSDHG